MNPNAEPPDGLYFLFVNPPWDDEGERPRYHHDWEKPFYAVYFHQKAAAGEARRLQDNGSTTCTVCFEMTNLPDVIRHSLVRVCEAKAEKKDEVLVSTGITMLCIHGVAASRVYQSWYANGKNESITLNGPNI